MALMIDCEICGYVSSVESAGAPCPICKRISPGRVNYERHEPFHEPFVHFDTDLARRIAKAIQKHAQEVFLICWERAELAEKENSDFKLIQAVLDCEHKEQSQRGFYTTS